MKPEYEIFHSKNDIISYIIKIWEKTVANAIQSQGQAFVALSGGNTPKPIYKALAAAEQKTLWNNIQLFLMDERFVPYNHPDSNFP